MKLNDKALRTAAQAEWENWGYQGRFREQSANPDYWPRGASRVVTAYLEALDAEGLADLYDYWCKRVEALPRSEVRKGDTYAYRGMAGEWRVLVAERDSGNTGNLRVLRRAPQPRQWAIGDRVDETRDLPNKTVVRDQHGFGYTYNAIMDSFSTPASGGAPLKCIAHPRIIWLPENGDES